MLASPHPYLRPWRKTDLEAFQALHADPDVAYWLGGALCADVATEGFTRSRKFLEAHGWGVWVVQDQGGSLVGCAGLQPVKESLPFYPGVEATWRLIPSARGKGFISLSMSAVLAHAFQRLDLEEIVTFTSKANVASQRVMERLGFERDTTRDFLHPALADDHPLRPHIFYSLRNLTGSPELAAD